jgi:hypothetical protein
MYLRFSDRLLNMRRTWNARECEQPCSTNQIGETTRHETLLRERTPDGETSHGLLQILNAGAIYFLVALGAGFVFEVVRLEVVAQHISEFIARIMEPPSTILAMIIGAKWVIDQFTLPPLPAVRLGVGTVALGFMILMECMVVLPLHGLSLGEYFTFQGSVIGTLPVSALGVLTVMPFLVGYHWER